MAELTPRMKELVQPYLAGIEPYDPNFTPTRINLSANENTYPVPAGVRKAVDAALAATPLGKRCYEKLSMRLSQRALAAADCGGLACVLIMSTAYLVSGSYNPFLYFRF